MTRKFSWNNRDGLAVGYSTRRPFVTPAVPLNSNFHGVVESYRAEKSNNARVNTTIPSALISFGGTPAANTVGYVNTGITNSAYTFTSVFADGTPANNVPAQGGAEILTPFRLYGCLPYVASGPALKAMSSYNLAGTAFNQAPTARFIVTTDEPKPIFKLQGGNVTFIINVDDGSGWRRLHDTSIVTDSSQWSLITAAAGGYNDVLLDFSQVGGRKRRRIEFLLSTQGLTSVGITGSSTYFEAPTSAKVLHVTDSLGNTAPDAQMSECYPSALMDYMGVKDWCLMAEGGSGYIATNNNAVRTHIDKLRLMASFPQYQDVSFILIQASVNDASFTFSQKLQAMQECLRYALQTWPNTPVIALGPTAANTLLSQSQSLDTDIALSQACSLIASPWLVNIQTMQGSTGLGIKGTGSLLVPAGNGNADFYFKADATHFAGEGHKRWAERLAPEIASSLAVLAGKEK